MHVDMVNRTYFKIKILEEEVKELAELSERRLEVRSFKIGKA
jgi:hypothetical protein